MTDGRELKRMARRLEIEASEAGYIEQNFERENMLLNDARKLRKMARKLDL